MSIFLVAGLALGVAFAAWVFVAIAVALVKGIVNWWAKH